MSKFRDLPADTLASIRFLSRLPIPYSEDTPLPNFQSQAHTFPLAGIAIAVPATIVASLAFWLGLPDAAVALLAIATTTIVTGALHEDGLADVADGFWGGHSKERKLEIMRDSSIGTYGTLALVLSIGLTAAFITGALGALSPVQFCLTLLAAAALSRTAMLWPWVALDNARPSSSEGQSGKKDEAGLSARFGMPDNGTLRATALTSLLPFVLLLQTIGVWSTVIILLAMGAATLVTTRIARHHIEGHTGDVLGATQQIAFLTFWFALAATTSAP